MNATADAPAKLETHCGCAEAKAKGIPKILLAAIETANPSREAFVMDFFSLQEIYSKTPSWMNANQGILTFLIFLATMTLGWVSGIFSALRRRLKLRVRLIDGPTFSCTFRTGEKHDDFDVHQTGIALYLHISNYGSAPTGVLAIEVGYHWHLNPFSKLWWRYRVGWFWIKNQSVALADFQASIGNSTKVYPFLTQINQLSAARPNTYLRIGETKNGIVYFEQRDSWGGCFPSPSRGYTRIKVRLRDAHGRQYVSKHKIPVIDRENALKYNPRFGETHQELRGEFLPSEELQVAPETDEDSAGNVGATK